MEKELQEINSLMYYHILAREQIQYMYFNVMFLTCGTNFLKLSMILELLASCTDDRKND